MNQDEDRILHGLYYFREMVNEEGINTGSEIPWLARHTFREGAEWHKEGKFQTLDVDQQSNQTHFRLITTEQERPLRYLEAKGLIEYSRPKVSTSMLRVRVTVAGADRARRLHTWFSRKSLWYRDHKDGVAGLLVAAMVAIVVSLLTNWLTHRGQLEYSSNSDVRDWRL
jgi:hypothetical protein